MPQITTNDGVTLHVTDTGPADGLTVVLLAGFTAPAASWAFQVDALTAAATARCAWTAARTGCPRHRRTATGWPGTARTCTTR